MDDCKSQKSVGTTRVPDDDLSGSGSSGNSLDTFTSSKVSHSRPERERGPTRKERKLLRAQKHYESQGKVFKGKEQVKQQQAELALGVKGSAASSMHSDIMEQKHLEPVPDSDEKQKQIEDALVKEIPVEMNRWVKMKNNEPFCVICAKVATEGHLKSIEHLKKIEEDCIGTMMAGVAGSTRRFNGDMCTGVPTKMKMYKFWGDALENLPSAAKQVHIKKGVVYDGKKTLTPDEVHYELGIVSYPGKGKYTDTSIYLPFHELPDVEVTATAEQMQITSPPEQGWWPVIALRTVEVDSRTKKLIVCWYQLLSDGRIIAWWIFI